MKSKISGRPNSNRRMNWIWISGIAFLLSFAASVIFIVYGKRFEELGIIGNIYYIILIPLGFSSAAFLAGAMKSYASFNSNSAMPYGTLKLAGPIVIFILVIGGGFIMPNLNKKGKFDLKMRIICDDSSSPFFNSGSVFLYIGKYTREESIHNNEVIFPDIPEDYYSKKGRVVPVIQDYQLANSGEVSIYRNEDSINNIHVVRTVQSLSTFIRGSLVNEKMIPIKNALLNFGSGMATCQTDVNGDFSLKVPLPSGEAVRLKILVNDVARFNEDVTLSAAVPLDLKIDLKH